MAIWLERVAVQQLDREEQRRPDDGRGQQLEELAAPRRRLVGRALIGALPSNNRCGGRRDLRGGIRLPDRNGANHLERWLGLHRLRHIHPWAIVAHFSGVALLFSLAFFFLGTPTAPASPTPQTKTLLLLLAVGSTATVGQLFLTKAFAAGPPAKIPVVNLTQVVFAMLLDVLLWDRRFNAPMLAGMALVMAPTAWLMTTQK